MSRFAGLLLVLSTPFQAAVAALSVMDAELPALQAQARACYLGFLELYELDYLRDDAPGETSTRCVRVSYLRNFSADALDTATHKVFRDRHGEALARAYDAELVRLGLVYAAVDVGDQDTYCLDPGAGGFLLRDGRVVIRFAADDFARRFMQIWVRGEDDAGMPLWAFARC